MANASKKNNFRANRQFDDYEYQQRRDDRSQKKTDRRVQREKRRNEKQFQED